MNRYRGPSEADFREARILGEELRKKLPNEFILATRITRNGKKLFPELHFKADPKIPGRFLAEVDPDFIMGRTREPRELSVKGTTGSSAVDPKAP